MKEFEMVDKMTENKRFEYWKDSDTAYDTKIKYGQYFRIIDKKDMVCLLNEQEETIQTQKDYIIRMGHGTIFEEMKRLKERNQRQYERLKEITDLMFKRDWKTLELMVDEWEKEEEQLQKYGG